MNVKHLFALYMLQLSPNALAIDVGVFGTIYPIVETPADKLIEQKIQNLSPQAKERLTSEIIEKTKASVTRPKGNSLPIVTKARSTLFDPTVHFDEAIFDETGGKVIIPKNSKVNPLDHVSLGKPLVFFDGDDKEQVEWVKRNHSDSTLILVNGEPLTLQKSTQRKIYFDQHGKLQKHFSLQFLPSVITQEGKWLRVNECVVS